MRRKQWWKQVKKTLPWKRLVVLCAITLALGLADILGVGHAIGGIWSTLLSGIFTIATGVVIPLWPTVFNSSSSSSTQAIPSPPSPTNSLQSQTQPVVTPITLSQSQSSSVGNTTVTVQPQSFNPPVVQSHTLPTIFYFNAPRLPNVDEFYGRRRERIALLNHTRRGICTSIVGPRRIGKTWLMDYLKLVAPTELDSTFLFATLDGTMPRCQTIQEFCARVFAGFGVPLATTQADMDILGRFVREQRARAIHPVLCIDEFEGFFNKQVFDYEFFANLRFIANNGLTLVINSKSRLIDLVGEQCKTSPFFNIFLQIPLEPFDSSEAEAFAQKKSAQAGWNDDERKALLSYGQEGENWPPLRLQLAGQMLLVDRHLAVTGEPDYYRPDDASYWREFERRLEKTYRAVVPR